MRLFHSSNPQYTPLSEYNKNKNFKRFTYYLNHPRVRLGVSCEEFFFLPGAQSEKPVCVFMDPLCAITPLRKKTKTKKNTEKAATVIPLQAICSQIERPSLPPSAAALGVSLRW